MYNIFSVNYTLETYFPYPRVKAFDAEGLRPFSKVYFKFSSATHAPLRINLRDGRLIWAKWTGQERGVRDRGVNYSRSDFKMKANGFVIADPLTFRATPKGQGGEAVRVIGKDRKEDTEMGMVVMETVPRDYIFLNLNLDWLR